MKRSLFLSLAVLSLHIASAQVPVAVGGGSYASYTPLGDKQVFTVRALNQFGYTEMETNELYEATALGDHELVVSLGGYNDTAHIRVVDFSEMNLALRKTATCSGSENDGTNASMAVDGDHETRWSSRFQDNEWLTVDLADHYYLNRIRIYWQDAYATDYVLLLSEDGVEFEAVYEASGAKGGVQDITLPEGRRYPARYVKLLCQKRNMQYGSSLWEFEVYGEGRVEQSTAVEQTAEGQQPADSRHAQTVLRYSDGHIYVLTPEKKVYTIDGRKIN